VLVDDPVGNLALWLAEDRAGEFFYHFFPG
jgi:hypothetical protein